MFDVKKLKQIISVQILDFKTLARKMNVPHFKNREFTKFLISLLNENEIGMTSKKEYFVPQIKKTITRIIKVHSRGFGFIDDEDNSIFISAYNINGAFNNDEVNVNVFKDPVLNNEYQGYVTKIVKRNTTEFVGTIKKFNGRIGIVPFNKNINGIFRFEEENNLLENDNVKVKIISYGKVSILKLVKKLEKSSGITINSFLAIEDANIPYEFSFKTIEESKKIPQEIDKNNLGIREDLREHLIVTIDGEDTKDFDDAIEVTKLQNDNYKLSVHIADVTHYVKENSVVDNEAKLRGTSVYLPNQVIPMLPKTLSNGICSLNPSVDRFTMSIDMEIDKTGKTINYQVYESVINSKYRLTYKEVNAYYHKQKNWPDKQLEKMLDYALELSKIIRTFKEKEGYIDFEIKESKIIVDENGKTTDIIVKERFESEILIEDFMVRANETVAKFVSENNLPFLYRIHDKPDLEKIQSLQGVIKILKIDVKIPHNRVPSEFAIAINQIKKTRFDDFMKIMMLRTMQKAIYSPTNIGHFGLASKAYSHFTSPIRRYPDLMVHRMLREYFFNKNKHLANHFKDILPTIAIHSSEAEQKAMDLERSISDMKKAEFYEKFIGKSFEGTIVSMMKFGFFVEFPNKVGGLVHISSLTDGIYNLSENGYVMSNGKRTFTIGDKTKVIVTAISKKDGKIDLAIQDIVNINKI